MNLYWLLVLAHLIGDFPLQTDRVFYYKHKTKWGILIHIALCTASNILMTIPFFIYPWFWLILLAMSILHLIYDKTKIWLTLTSKRLPDNFPLFLFDQFLHFATIVIAGVVFYRLNPNAAVMNDSIWANLPLVQLLAGFILIIFAIAPSNYFIINDYYHYFRKLKRPFWVFPKVPERIWGYLERGLIAFAVVFQGWWFVLIPIAIIPRFLFMRNNNLFDFGLSVFFSLAIALFMNQTIVIV